MLDAPAQERRRGSQQTDLLCERWPHRLGQKSGCAKWNSARVTLCRLVLKRFAEVDHIRGPAVQGGMRPARIVEREVSGEALVGLRHRVVGVEVDLLVLHALPEALDEEVVPPGTLPVHAEGDTVRLNQIDEGGAGELAALVGVEDPPGQPQARMADSRASTQQSVVSVFERRQASTRRVAQSKTATR